ncbi:unnamed protein product [Linum trigynum]|uniref:Uncharacterized protein n=1 Tax=Linum trigynum TaxID=586398 RepID=A0AAV2CMJ7_9ROSI
MSLIAAYQKKQSLLCNCCWGNSQVAVSKFASTVLICQTIAEVADLNLTCNFWADFLIGKKLQLPSFHDCLMERGTVQMLTVGREAAIEVQVQFLKIS